MSDNKKDNQLDVCQRIYLNSYVWTVTGFVLGFVSVCITIMATASNNTWIQLLSIILLCVLTGQVLERLLGDNGKKDDDDFDTEHNYDIF